MIGNSINPLLERYSEGLNDADAPAGPSIRFTIFTPSAYYPHKNLEIIPRVAEAMRRQDPNLDFEFRLTLAEESAEWRRQATEAHRLGVGARIVTMGILDAGGLARAYKAASAVFLPTLREASTAVYPESFFFGRPLVTSDLDFARELCGEAALFVPPLQPEKIASRLIELAQSADLRSVLVAAGNRQLARGYPSPAEKFSMQLEMLSQVESGKDTTTQGGPRHSVAIVLHFLSHYREAIYRHLSGVERGGNAYFIYSDTKSNIPSLKVLDFNSAAAATPTPGKITWLRLINVWFGQYVCWQRGVLSLAGRREHDTLIFMGSMYFLSSWLGCLIGRLRGKRILMWGHGFRYHERGLKGLVRGIFYRLAHGHLLYGHHAREIMLAKGFDPNGLYVIYNTLDIEYLNSKLETFLKDEGGQPSSAHPGTLKLVMIGRITIEKRLDLLIEALAMLRRSGVEVQLTVIGDGPDREAVVSRAHTLGVSDYIGWLGALYDERLICPHIATADLCVVPGKLGLTAVHAMTYGTPVITHDDFETHSPEFEVIVPGRTGMFFRKGDAADLTRKILSWQAQMHDRTTLRQRCRQIVCTYYTPQMQRYIIDKAVDGVPANHIPEASTRPKIEFLSERFQQQSSAF